MDLKTVWTVVRDAIVVITCLAVLVFLYRVNEAANNIRDSFGGGGSPPTEQQQDGGYFDDNGNWCYDPGGGVVCDGD